MTPLSPGAPAEPLIYQTQQRMPGEQGGFRPRRPQAERIDDDALPPTQALPAQDAPQYRRRDFSPEGRRAVPSWAPAYAQGDGGYPSSERLDYQTLGHQEVRAAVERSRGTLPEDSADQAAEGAGAPVAGAVPPGSATPGSASAGAVPPVTGAIPMSTPDQPLTRRQLRALREQQEREGQGDDAQVSETREADSPASDASSGSADSADRESAAPPTDGDRPAARPWAPVFYSDQDDSAAPADVEGADVVDGAPESTTRPEAAASAEPSAPATFAVPVISADAAAADAASRESATTQSAAAQGEAPSGESLDDWMAKVFEGDSARPAAANDAPDAAVPTVDDSPATPDAATTDAGTTPEPALGTDPVALVEPPEPSHWAPGSGQQPGSPAVFDALFAPPSQADAAPTSVPSAESTAERPADAVDPLEFLGAQPAASDRVDLPAPGAWAPGSGGRTPPTGPTGPTGPASADPAPADPGAEEIVVEAEPAESGPASDGEVHPVIVDAQPLPAEPIDRTPADTAHPSGEVPTGHWTQQAIADDEQTVSRDVGGGHGVVTTNALVLPSIPQPELAGPLTHTGEILITGSIDLPRSLSSTGAHPTQLDESSLDHELDPGDQQVVSADSQPIRAIRAVSTHTSTRGMMLNTKPKGNRSLTVLIIVTAALAVGVGVVLVVGLLNNAF